MTKQILVTGGAGFIGSHITRRLIDKGDAVWVVDNLLTGSRENMPSEAAFLELDLSQPEAFEKLPDIRFDAVLHLAAQSSGQISHEKPAYDLMTNTLGTLLLLKWCEAKKIDRFLYASSMGVYGNVERLPVTETVCCQPCSFYGITKLASEHYINYFYSHGMKTTVFRMFNVYGPGQNLSNLKQGMVSIYLAFILKKEPVLVKGSKDRFRDFIYIDDVVDAWMTALDNPESFGKTYNLASGTKTYVWQLIEEEIKAFGYNPDTYPVEYTEGTPGDQFGIWADISRIKAALEWKPHTTLSAGLGKMVAWAQSLSSS